MVTQYDASTWDDGLAGLVDSFFGTGWDSLD